RTVADNRTASVLFALAVRVRMLEPAHLLRTCIPTKTIVTRILWSRCRSGCRNRCAIDSHGGASADIRTCSIAPANSLGAASGTCGTRRRIYLLGRTTFLGHTFCLICREKCSDLC